MDYSKMIDCIFEQDALSIQDWKIILLALKDNNNEVTSEDVSKLVSYDGCNNLNVFAHMRRWARMERIGLNIKDIDIVHLLENSSDDYIITGEMMEHCDSFVGEDAYRKEIIKRLLNKRYILPDETVHKFGYYIYDDSSISLKCRYAVMNNMESNMLNVHFRILNKKIDYHNILIKDIDNNVLYSYNSNDTKKITLSLGLTESIIKSKIISFIVDVQDSYGNIKMKGEIIRISIYDALESEADEEFMEVFNDIKLMMGKKQEEIIYKHNKAKEKAKIDAEKKARENELSKTMFVNEEVDKVNEQLSKSYREYSGILPGQSYNGVDEEINTFINKQINKTK